MKRLKVVRCGRVPNPQRWRKASSSSSRRIRALVWGRFRTKADVGAPEGLERVSLPAGGPVLLKLASSVESSRLANIAVVGPGGLERISSDG